jgi:DNA-binding MarR family transcriptional regulator
MKRVGPQLPPRHRPLSDDALETSKLVVELVHAALATRDGDAPGARGRTDTSWRISPHAVRATIHIYQHGERTIGELASGLGVSLGWASRVVSELDEAGLVTRSADPGDRRVVRVSLAPEALTIVEDAYRWRGDAIEHALAGLDADGRAAVRTFLRQAIDQLRVGPKVHED